MFGRDRDKIRILGDIIEPIGVTWEAEKGKNVGGGKMLQSNRITVPKPYSYYDYHYDSLGFSRVP